MNNARFIIQISKGLIRDSRMRRLTMFYTVLGALLMLFAGGTLFWPFLRDHPFLFLGYWAACAWVTLLAVLLAIYDLARVRSEARRTQRQIEDEYLRSKSDSPPDDSQAH